MSWTNILKKFDYNDLDDDAKQEINKALLGKGFLKPSLLYFSHFPHNGDFYLFEEKADSHIPIEKFDMGFPKDFELSASGEIEIYNGNVFTDVSIYIRHKNMDYEDRYYIGNFKGKKTISKDVEKDIIESRDLRKLKEYLPEFNPEQERYLFAQADYNKLVSYLKETNKWKDISDIGDTF